MSGRWIRSAANLWRSSWLKPLNDVEALDDALSLVRADWSLSRIRARVVDIRQETADTRTFVLRPNRLWRAFAAGQHVVVEVEVNGVRHHRSFSLSSSPREKLLAITVKRHGKVTDWMHRHLGRGDVITLSPAAGRFVLPEATPSPILLLSAGSGITPIVSLLRELSARGHAGQVTLVHSCRNPGDFILEGELATLALPNLQLHVHYTSGGRLAPQRVAQLVPDFAQRDTWMCGPAGFMDAMRAHWHGAGAIARLHEESFGPPAPRVAAGAPVQVQAARSGVGFTGGSRALLLEAESAGLSPKSGCRIGICQTCKCVKRSGTVENLVTGKISSEPGEQIQLCISAARSDLVLEL